jgi:sporulation protein YlmC with PRC-barrel domain
MLRITKLAVAALACCAVGSWTVNSFAAGVRGDRTQNMHTYRSSKLVGMSVRDPQGEKLGTVDDLVINMSTGQISYVALGFGGILGVGEKLFAVPFNQLKFEHNSNDTYFVLNATKEKLKAAPGFDKNHWPDLADPNWSQDVDKYYQHAETKTTTSGSVKTSEKK